MLIILSLMCWNLIGYLASLLVLAAFAAKAIIPLRSIAIASNIAFLSYGIALGLTPVWLLHALLLPLNAWRLSEALLRYRKANQQVAQKSGAEEFNAPAYPSRSGRWS